VSLGRFQNRNLPGMNNFRQHGVEDELKYAASAARSWKRDFRRPQPVVVYGGLF
jgi:hypothetical protein